MSGWVAVTSSLYFAVVTVGYARQAWGVQHAARRVHEVIHAVMGAVMVVMPWPAWMGVPAVWPVMFFSAAAAWYVYTILGDAHGGHGAVTAVLHAVMSAAMVWMVVAMTPMTPMAPAGMPAMHEAMSAAGMTGTQEWARVVTGVTAVLLVVGALVRIAATVRRSAARPGDGMRRWTGAVLDTAMAAGMAVALLLLTR